MNHNGSSVRREIIFESESYLIVRKFSHSDSLLIIYEEGYEKGLIFHRSFSYPTHDKKQYGSAFKSARAYCVELASKEKSHKYMMKVDRSYYRKNTAKSHRGHGSKYIRS